VLLVNPIRDGMNLVARRDRSCPSAPAPWSLSTEAGAAAELGGDALLVNPFDVTQTAEALHRALTMPPAERAQRAAGLSLGRRRVPAQRVVPGPARRARLTRPSGLAEARAFRCGIFRTASGEQFPNGLPGLFLPVS